MAAMAVALCAVTLLTVNAYLSTPPAVVEERGVRLSAAEIAGRQLVLAQNCGACHIVAGHGTRTGPDLDGIGSRRDASYIHTYIERPASLNPAATMPAYIPPLSHEQVEEITKYLLVLR
jgi:cbb3-type cytochrome oxidase cytochrome c subunit